MDLIFYNDRCHRNKDDDGCGCAEYALQTPPNPHVFLYFTPDTTSSPMDPLCTPREQFPRVA